MASAQLGLIPLGPDPHSTLEEFCETATGDVPRRGPDGVLAIGERTALVFVLLPGGSFTMGAQSNDPDTPHYDPLAVGNEGPPHEIRLSPFLLSKHEMTQGQWLAATGTNPSHFPPGNQKLPHPVTLRHPVEQVSWDDCHLVLRRLGLSFPTEAQWEYGCRAGTHSVWWTGDERAEVARAANVADKSLGDVGHHETEPWDDGWVGPAPVGSFAANAFGLHDVHGNVCEWCLDFFDWFRGNARPGDGLRNGPEARDRIYRGGCFNFDARGARASMRPRLDTSTRSLMNGVRPSRILVR
jgi:formylglycine-generating enzyme required for sulfatase activity